MYKCNKCKKTTRSGESQNKVITQKRERVYSTPIFDRFDNESERLTHGFEIIKEECFCNECYAKHKGIKDYTKSVVNKSKSMNAIEPLKNAFKNTPQSESAARSYPNSNYKGKNFDPNYHKNKHNRK